MVLPTIIAKCDEFIMVTKIKRTYSELANAIEMMKIDNEANNYAEIFPGNSSTEILTARLAKYLDIVEVCTSAEIARGGCGGTYTRKSKTPTIDENGNYEASKAAGNVARFTLKDGTFVTVKARSHSGDCITEYHDCLRDPEGYYELDENGEKQCYMYESTHCAEIFFDVNGLSGLNQYGYDCFSFAVTPYKVEQHGGYGGIYDTMIDGKLTYTKYTIGEPARK